MKRPGDGTMKPLDLGTGRVCASFDATTAAWLSIGSVHHGQGFVELSDLPPFDETLRGDPRATRGYREAMADAGHALLAVEIDGARLPLQADPSRATEPRWHGDGIAVVASATPDADHVSQTWTIRRGSGTPPSVTVRLSGRIDRPALAEITELDPPVPTGATTGARLEPGEVRLESSLLDTIATVAITGAEASWELEASRATARLRWPDRSAELRFTLTVSLDSGLPPGNPLALAEEPTGDPIVGRAIAYVRGCTALRAAGDERVLLTDHRILPLSWTRDAYWQALALLAAGGPGDRERVADHLRWLWRRCERQDGRWVRSHHADGRRKDLALQADQQLYPLVELADYWRTVGGLPTGVAWDVEVERAWAAVAADTDGELALVASAENAADDPAVAPFIGSSQILLWYVAERIAELCDAGALRLDAERLRLLGHATRAAFDRHFAHGGGPWPYAIDAAGGRVAYHDANDLPVALAPLWGFCPVDDAGWRATMRFAFSPENSAWFDGRRAGLGSVHTPGPWTLGDLQAWLVARLAGDEAAATAAVQRLESVAYADGMLPEAYGADSARRVRSWFAWPGAAYAALRLLDRSGRLEASFAIRAG